MPFTKFTPSIEESHTNNPDELPIFLLPGILGNSNELYSMAAAINEMRGGKTPIYIYEEPDINGAPLKMSLEEHAKSIAEEIREIRQNSPLPYIIGGNSFGGILTYLVSANLSAAGHDARNLLIDIPSIEYMQKYIIEDGENFRADVFKIVNYAASLTGLTELKITPEFLAKMQANKPGIQKLELEDRIDYLLDYVASELLGQQSSSKNELIPKFYFYIQTAQRNLRNMAVAKPDTSEKLRKINVIFTKETATKHGFANPKTQAFTGGWEEHCDELNQLNSPISSKLANQKHMDLLKEDNATLVANLFIKQLTSEITSDFLMLKQFQKIFGGPVKPEAMNLIKDLIAAGKSSKRASMQFFNIFNPPVPEEKPSAASIAEAPKQSSDSVANIEIADTTPSCRVV